MTLISKYEFFAHIVRTARMDGIFADPQSKVTVFVPLESELPQNAHTINFETARNIVDSVTVPWITTTTMMKQSPLSKYRTRHAVNSLYVQTDPNDDVIVLNRRSRIVVPNNQARNGVLHVVDKFPYE
jgi:hypothetical protein